MRQSPLRREPALRLATAIHYFADRAWERVRVVNLHAIALADL